MGWGFSGFVVKVRGSRVSRLQVSRYGVRVFDIQGFAVFEVHIFAFGIRCDVFGVFEVRVLGWGFAVRGLQVRGLAFAVSGLGFGVAAFRGSRFSRFIVSLFRV